MPVKFNSIARLCSAGALAIATLHGTSQQIGRSNAQTQNMPAWQRAAGGHAEFEVAAVRPDPAGKFVEPGFSMDADDSFKDTGGLFVADMSVASYISFAYRLPLQYSTFSNLPDWTRKENFAIQARAAGNPTKDEFRLMMQSLLAEQFKLAIHFDMDDRPVLVMKLAKPGKMGPRLRLHSDGPPCDVVATRPKGAEIAFEMFPCHVILGANEPDNTLLAGARDTTVELMAAFFDNVGSLGRPIVDRTGIEGNVDFSMKYTRPTKGPVPSTGGEASEPGTSFTDAIREQLGLKLEPETAPVRIMVIDNVERPSAN